MISVRNLGRTAVDDYKLEVLVVTIRYSSTRLYLFRLFSLTYLKGNPPSLYSNLVVNADLISSFLKKVMVLEMKNPSMS
jgi:hypothetical protein